MKSITTLFLSFLFTIQTFGQENKNNPFSTNHFPLPKVDKRVELLSIVFRLAGNQEYNQNNFKDYVKDIHDHFDKYKEHPLIVFAKELHEKSSISYDAVASMAVYLEQPPTLNPVLPFTSGIPENRWGVDNANKFVKLLQQFYVDAKCEDFFNKHEQLYRLAAERFKEVSDALDINWFKDYYGKQPDGSFNIFLGLGTGGNCYGPKVIFPNGREDDFAIMGTWTFDNSGKPIYDVKNFLPTLVHEFNHSFINRLVEKNENELESACRQLFEPIKDILKRQAYSNWKTMMHEALVRASVIRYMNKHVGADSTAAKKEMIKREISNGFIWMDKLSNALQSYEQSRDKYPTLESFMPAIIAFYNSLARNSNETLERCAHVTSIEPFNNYSNDVSPDLKEMKVRFDKPLAGKGYSVYLGQKGMDHFPVKGVKYADNNSSVYLDLQLKSNTDYEFVLVGQRFTTPEGYPLIDYYVSFKTTE